MATDKNLFKGLSRRDWLKILGGIPIFGAVWTAGFRSNEKALSERNLLLETLNIKASAPPTSGPMTGEPLRVGLIGFGIRGEQLMRSLGFATKEWIDDMVKSSAENPDDKRLAEFKAQESLNVKLTAICDIFDIQAEKALQSFNTRENPCKRYRTYRELFNSGEIDAVIIATPDHWHAPMAISAIEAGLHVYVEKPMTHTIQ